ncbi:hypothetical protein [Candidatus Manganitrophus noduliformans]|uniref:hypothetical protein n=1 Tax=Candidatus Manganitrophus noduliformans TaxID=2606439 RepID=UPI0015E482AE|nr:hypothetical protein [Candidatus Manganitrophus noduliformans]
MKIQFPDTTSLTSMQGIELKQGALTKEGPVLFPQYPWEGIHAYLYGSVLERNGQLHMWYQSYLDGDDFFVNYARSRDGKKWEKPLINKWRVDERRFYPTIESEKERETKAIAFRNGSPGYWKTNIVSTYHIPSVIYDPEDSKRPYKLFGFTNEGYRVAFSKDGIHFKEYEGNPVLPLMRFPNPKTKKNWVSDVSPVFKDDLKKKFIAFAKTYVIDEEGRTRRSVGYSESDDFIRWSPPETIWTPSAADDRLAVARGFKWADFYGLCGFNYGAGYLGLLWLFYMDYEFAKGTHEGKMEVFLATSPDGKQWSRFSDEPLIPLSESGWDSGMITTANLPLFRKEGIDLYYGGSNFSHGVGNAQLLFDEQSHRFSVGLATLRKDGFVYAAGAKGTMTTKPLTCLKGTLRINADATGGRVRINLCKGGQPVESFRMEGIDSSDHLLRTGVRGEVTLKISVEGAKLYSLEVC